MLHDANEFMLHDANAQLPLASSLPGTDPSKRARSPSAMLTVDNRPNATMLPSLASLLGSFRPYHQAVVSCVVRRRLILPCLCVCGVILSQLFVVSSKHSFERAHLSLDRGKNGLCLERNKHVSCIPHRPNPNSFLFFIAIAIVIHSPLPISNAHY